jgi:SOS-response transcriptional repressor LexA
MQMSLITPVKDELTVLQRQVYEYLKVNPTAKYREIMAAIGFNGVGSVQAVIRALAKKGFTAERRKPGSWVVYAKRDKSKKVKTK